MVTKVLFFAGLRESLGISGEEVSLPSHVATVADLRVYLMARGGAWEALAQGKNLRVAVNQRLADAQAVIRDGDEVAFFPPVTGG
jgi:molybdopterin synthase sulfur carrier subunit